MFNKSFTTLLKSSIWHRQIQRRLVTQLQQTGDAAIACLPLSLHWVLTQLDVSFLPFQVGSVIIAQWMATSSYRETAPNICIIAHAVNIAYISSPSHYWQHLIITARTWSHLLNGRLRPLLCLQLISPMGLQTVDSLIWKTGNALWSEYYHWMRIYVSFAAFSRRLWRSPTPLEIANTSEDRQHLWRSPTPLKNIGASVDRRRLREDGCSWKEDQDCCLPICLT